MVFHARYGHFKYQVMFFSLSNTPASVPSTINKILAKKLDIFDVMYLDDILIYTKDPDQSNVEAIQ